MRRKGIATSPSLEMGSLEAVKAVVAAGLGFTVLSRSTVRLELETGVLRTARVAGLSIERAIGVILPAGAAPPRPTFAFLEALAGPERAAWAARVAEDAQPNGTS